MSELTEAELRLLAWLGEEEYNQYGECHGPILDSLIEKGLAQVHDEPPVGFAPIVYRTGNIMYQAVSLTERGEELLDDRG